MAIVTIKINEKSSMGKAIMDLLRSSAKESDAIQFVEPQNGPEYKKEFVNKVLKSDKSDKRIRIKTDRLWESI